MTRFAFKAFTEAGSVREGEVEADTRSGAVEVLARQGLTPFETSPVGHAEKEAWWNRDIGFGRGLSGQALASLTRELSTLIGADLPIDEALRILADQSAASRQRHVYRVLHERVVGGASVSDAMTTLPETFPDFYVSLVHSGEEAGTLAMVLADLAEHLERKVEIANQLRSALIYPFMLLAVALVSLGVIVTVLVPQIAPLFEGRPGDTPFVVWAVQAARSGLAEQWPAVSVAGVVVVACSTFAWRSEAIVDLRHAWACKAPVFGSLVVRTETAKIMRSLGMLLKGGVPLLDALAIGRSIAGNRVFRAAMDETIDRVREGAALHEALTASKAFPDFAIRLVAIGERVGSLGEMSSRAAHILEVQSKRQVDRYMMLLTPILTLAIGAGVGTLIMSVMGAILSVNEFALR